MLFTKHSKYQDIAQRLSLLSVEPNIPAILFINVLSFEMHAACLFWIFATLPRAAHKITCSFGVLSFEFTRWSGTQVLLPISWTPPQTLLLSLSLYSAGRPIQPQGTARVSPVWESEGRASQWNQEGEKARGKVVRPVGSGEKGEKKREGERGRRKERGDWKKEGGAAEEEVRRLGGLADWPPAGAAWAVRVAGAPGSSSFRDGATEWERTRPISYWPTTRRPRRHWTT